MGVPSAAGASAKGAVVTQTLACAGATGRTCGFTIRLTSVEHLRGSRLLSVSAARTRGRAKRVTVGLLSVTLHAGQVKTVKVPLNATGRALLKRFHRLPVTVTTSSTSASGKAVRLAARRLTLSSPRTHARKA
jgi:hypothetical protein